MTGVEPSFALDANWSEVALALFAQGTVRDTLQQIVDLAVVAVEGCDAAGIFLVEDERVVTTAFSEPLVVVLDGMQFEADEGPCLDAVADGGVFYAEDLAGDPRWSTFGPAATAAGIRSLIAYALSADRPSALNLYARLPLAFGAMDRAKGLIFATLAGIALSTAEERASEAHRLENLHQALRSRETIGQAQGILMVTSQVARRAIRAISTTERAPFARPGAWELRNSSPVLRPSWLPQKRSWPRSSPRTGRWKTVLPCSKPS